MNLIRHQLNQALVVNPSRERMGYSAEFTASPDFIGFQGHFPGHPVLPGICLITACLVATEQVAEKKMELHELRSAKFLKPVLPGQKVMIRAELSPDPDTGLLGIKADLTSVEQGRVARIRLTARSQTPA